jgi:hypothetical protein
VVVVVVVVAAAAVVVVVVVQQVMVVVVVVVQQVMQGACPREYVRHTTPMCGGVVWLPRTLAHSSSAGNATQRRKSNTNTTGERTPMRPYSS